MARWRQVALTIMACLAMMAMAAVWLAPHAAAAPARAATLAQPVDLRQEAALIQRWGQPLVILFSMPDCSYCVEVRNNYLAPMALAAGPGSGPVVREVDMTSRKTIRGFSGEVVTLADFARRYGIKVSPTVVMLGPKGELLAEPLIGSGMAGFYGAYLERVLDTATKALRTDRKPGG